MMKRKIITFVFWCTFGSMALFFIGCGGGGGGNNQDPNRGFDVLILANNIPTSGRVVGQFQSGSGTYGSRTSFDEVTNGGVWRISSAKVPGTWRMAYGPDFSGSSLCLGVQVVDRNVSLGSLEHLHCVPRFYSFTASPDTIDALNPPATVTFSGKGIENIHGMPTLAFYNEFGQVVASTTANQLLWENGEIEGLTVNVPDISEVYDGTYTIAVHNVQADGSWEIIGAAPITIYGNPPPPPPPPPGGGGCEQAPPDQPQLPCEQQQ